MFKSLRLIIDAYRQGGSKLSVLGLLYVGLNLLLSSAAWFGLNQASVPLDQPDNIAAILLGTSTLALLGMYVFVTFIPLKRYIKRTLMLGLFLVQLGLLVETTDGTREFARPLWQHLGDLCYLVGAIIVMYASTLWVVFTYRMSTRDKLTGVYNRRYFEATLVNQLKFLRRKEDQRGCLMTLDIDNFKQINDRFGHAMGDEVLTMVGEVLINSARRQDYVCRAGGEEFELLLVGISSTQAEQVGTRILQGLYKQTPTPLESVTASIGIAYIRADDDLDSLRRRADQAMYRAKQGGKAQIKLAEE